MLACQAMPACIDQWRDEPDWPLPDTSYVAYYLHGSGRANTVGGDGRLSAGTPDGARRPV
jgi:uncharacterized protein